MNIYQRIVAVMGDLEYIKKGDKKVNGQYSFVSHDAVTAAIHPLLVKHGIACIPTVSEFVQNGNRTELKLDVTFVNAEKPEDCIQTTWIGFGIDPQDKGVGKAISYAFKYCILKTFVLETGDDPERDLIEFEDGITEEEAQYVIDIVGDDSKLKTVLLGITKELKCDTIKKCKRKDYLRYLKAIEDYKNNLSP